MESILYDKINPYQLERLLESLYCCLDLPIRALDEDGRVLCRFGDTTSYCAHFKKLLLHYSVNQDSCREVHAQAGKRAMKARGAYVFSCHANLSHIVIPLVLGKQQLGSILIGPFLTEEPGPSLIEDISAHYPFPLHDLLALHQALKDIRVVPSKKVEQVSWLVSCLFSSLLSQNLPSPETTLTTADSHPASGAGLSPAKGMGAIQNALAYMSSHYEEPLTLSETAAYVKLNPSYFSTLFKKTMGASFKEHLNEIRIRESKKLLAASSYSIIDIAIMTGFEDQSYFTKVFKKITGLTPSQYRNQEALNKDQTKTADSTEAGLPTVPDLPSNQSPS